MDLLVDAEQPVVPVILVVNVTVYLHGCENVNLGDKDLALLPLLNDQPEAGEIVQV